MTGKKENVEIWKSYFIASKILNDVQRCLLYFNLPFADIIRDEVKPKLLFDCDLKQDVKNVASRNNFLNEMLNSFEQAKDGKNRLANIILLQVPNS